MRVTQKRTDTILQALQDKHDLEYCSHYGEPGYSDPETGILFANWNNISRRIGNYLKAAGCKLEWCDEWTIDYNNDKAWRTSPDSYGWQCQVRYTDDGEMITPDDGAQEFIEHCAMTDYKQPARVVPSWVTEADIEAEGYTAINGVYENGFHPGQDDNPQDIARKAFENGAQSVVFRLHGVGQFDVHFQGFAKYPE